MFWKTILAGSAAGIINGLFGAGGGMVLVPLLTALTDLEDRNVFPASISIILPMCLVSLSISAKGQALPWSAALPYLIGGLIGGILGGILFQKVSASFLHKLLGAFILWGGVRLLF